MSTALCLTVGCLGAWLVVSLLAPELALTVALGMLAPLVAVLVTMPCMKRRYRRDPRTLTPFMIAAFGTKMAGFGAYVALVVSLAPLDPLQFAVSFAASFIVLHGLEAFWLRSLVARAATDTVR